MIKLVTFYRLAHDSGHSHFWVLLNVEFGFYYIYQARMQCFKTVRQQINEAIIGKMIYNITDTINE